MTKQKNTLRYKVNENNALRFALCLSLKGIANRITCNVITLSNYKMLLLKKGKGFIIL